MEEKSLSQANNYATKILSNKWVKWVHKNTRPAYTNIEKVSYISSLLFSRHCPICLNLNECIFSELNCPENPQHENCHCVYEATDLSSVEAECKTEKWTNYIFNEIFNNGKKKLFESWGFSIIDSSALKSEFEAQAKLAYLCGNYILGKLDFFGQRISILITLERPDGNGKLTFLSGWLLYPDGKIVLTTPYGGNFL